MSTLSPRERLRLWFTDSQIQMYFGARSRDELAQVADLMQRMSTDSRRKFKLQLQKLVGEMARR